MRTLLAAQGFSHVLGYLDTLHPDNLDRQGLGGIGSVPDHQDGRSGMVQGRLRHGVEAIRRVAPTEHQQMVSGQATAASGG